MKFWRVLVIEWKWPLNVPEFDGSVICQTRFEAIKNVLKLMSLTFLDKTQFWKFHNYWKLEKVARFRNNKYLPQTENWPSLLLTYLNERSRHSVQKAFRKLCRLVSARLIDHTFGAMLKTEIFYKPLGHLGLFLFIFLICMVSLLTNINRKSLERLRTEFERKPAEWLF